MFKIISIIQFKIISFAPRKQNKGRSTGYTFGENENKAHRIYLTTWLEFSRHGTASFSWRTSTEGAHQSEIDCTRFPQS